MADAQPAPAARDAEESATPPGRPRVGPRPRRAVGDATRRRLLDAGRSVFTRSGFAGSSVQSVLDEAGVSPPVLYHHFGNKLGLFLAVADEVYTRFVDELTAAVAGAESFDGALDSTIRAAGRLHADDPTLAPMAITVQTEARRDPELRQALRPVLVSFHTFVAGMAGLAPRDVADRTTPRAVTLAISTILNGLSGLAAALHDPAEFTDTAEALRLLLGGRR